MDHNDFNYLDTDTSRDQPGIFPHALSFMGQSIFMREKEPSVRFLAMDIKEHDNQGGTDDFNGYLRNTGTVGGILMRNATNDPQKAVPISVNAYGYPQFEYMFMNLYEEEKDRIMRSLHDDVLFARLYKVSKKFHAILNTRPEQDDIPGIVPPALLTTKPVMLPEHVKRGFRENRDGMLEYLKQDITPGTFHSQHFSDHNFETLAHMAHKYGNEIHPSQFVAMRHQYVQDLKNGDLLIGPTEDAYQYTPAEREILFADRYCQVDRWRVFCVSPYAMTPVAIYEDVMDAASFLQDAEAHFIDPYYQKDRKMAFLEERLQILSDFRPSHHSKLTIEQVMLARDPTIGMPN